MIWLVAMFFLTASGCLSRKTVLQKYYLIEVAVTTDSTLTKSQPRTAASCGIAPVEIHPAFAGTRIAVRTHTHELNYYAHHKWAMRPEETLTRLIQDYLQSHGIFAIVSSRTWQHVPDYLLQTQVKQLEVVQQDNKLSAHLNIEFQLVAHSSREVAVFHTSNRRIPLQENDLNLFASAISESFYKELQLFSEKITTYLHSVDTDETSKL